MSSQITLKNGTSTSPITFGLWSAPHDHQDKKDVSNTESVVFKMGDNDARIVGVWTDSDNLYPTNDNPYVTGAYFEDGKDYTVNLTTTGISVTVDAN
jgi:hypothetical protein